MKVSFNNPKNAGTKIDAAIYAFGPTCTEIHNELSVWLDGAFVAKGIDVDEKGKKSFCFA